MIRMGFFRRPVELRSYLETTSNLLANEDVECDVPGHHNIADR